jgi:hypothetical protein
LSYNASTGIIDGLFAITPLELQTLIDNHEDICFRVYGCRNDVICVTEICFSASELAGGAKSMSFNSLNEDSKSAPEKEQYFCTDFSLHPNPAINTITVNCRDSEFLSAVIFDMKGQKLRTVSEKSIVISDLQPGDYIVKVISSSGKCQYLKFVKQ